MSRGTHMSRGDTICPEGVPYVQRGYPYVQRGVPLCPEEVPLCLEGVGHMSGRGRLYVWGTPYFQIQSPDVTSA